jgi:signal transduction histidine kinase
MKLQYMDVSIKNAINDILTILGPLASKKHLRVKSSEIDDITISADEGKLKQILLNLPGNAIKFTPTGGSVTASTDLKDEMLNIWIKDTGIGISPADRKKLFIPFNQLDGPFTENTKEPNWAC